MTSTWASITCQWSRIMWERCWYPVSLPIKRLSSFIVSLASSSFYFSDYYDNFFLHIIINLKVIIQILVKNTSRSQQLSRRRELEDSYSRPLPKVEILRLLTAFLGCQWGPSNRVRPWWICLICRSLLTWRKYLSWDCIVK